MNQDTFAKLLAFLQELQQKRIWYNLAHHRDDAIMVQISVPGQQWEVEFLVDGTVEIEQFISDGDIHGEDSLKDLFARFGEQDAGELQTTRDGVQYQRPSL